MFDHVTIRASDRDASERFYGTVLRTLGVEQTHSGPDFAEWRDFSLAQADEEHPVTRGLHIGFRAPSHEHVDEFWRTGTAAGHPDDGAPGPRRQYSESYYGAFLLDPDGNSAEAVHHDAAASRSAVVDHLWIRVADLADSKRFYETIAPHAGFAMRAEPPGRAQFANERGSFSVVVDERPATEHAHVAFPAPDDATVEAFHRAATEAGYRDNGAPGERPGYHAGYYGAYVLDPDGSNVEVVNHNR
jgi:catechol 2,3-dioxygenase-like lactoylglutathione lyase family enzyme